MVGLNNGLTHLYLVLGPRSMPNCYVNYNQRYSYTLWQPVCPVPKSSAPEAW